MPAVVADDALRLPCRPGGVEDVERVGRGDRRAPDGLSALGGHELIPVVLPGRQLGAQLLALEHDPVRRLDRGPLDRLVEEGLVRHDPSRLDPARGGDDRHRGGIVDPGCQLGRRETAEDDRVHRADPRTGEHGDDGLRDHRHVDDDPVALDHAQRGQRPGEAGHLVEQLGIGERALGPGDRRVVVQRDLVGPPPGDMPVKGVVAGVEGAAAEPPVERRVRVVEDARRRGDPVDRCRGLPPEGVWVGEAGGIRARVGALSHERQCGRSHAALSPQRTRRFPQGRHPCAERSRPTACRWPPAGPRPHPTVDGPVCTLPLVRRSSGMTIEVIPPPDGGK